MNLFIHIGFLDITWIDLLDILLVTFLLYQLYQLIKGSVALRILLGGMAVFAIWILVSASGMELLGTILGQFINLGVIAALILFQQEIRKFLLVIGKGYLARNMIQNLFWRNQLATHVEIDMIVETAQELSTAMTGALIVFARSSELKFYAESGDAIDAVASKRLLLSIFNKLSPLHDGAVIIGQSGRIKAARCILPVSDNDELPASLGLRHRAAIGMSEVTDALVLIVSEETGDISIAKNGKIFRPLSPKLLKDKLILNLTRKNIEEEEDEIAKAAEELIEKPKFSPINKPKAV